jgi:hypothetical protein
MGVAPGSSSIKGWVPSPECFIRDFDEDFDVAFQTASVDSVNLCEEAYG